MRLRSTRLTAIAQAVAILMQGDTAIQDLFAAGEQGVWYDPSDINLDWRYNLLTYTEQFDNAVWVKSGASVTANVAVAPDGTTTADKLVESATTTEHRVYIAGVSTLSSQVSLTQSIYCKPNGRNFLNIICQDNSQTPRVVIDITNNTYQLPAAFANGGSLISVSSLPVEDGWYRVSVSWVTSTSPGQINTYCQLQNSASSGHEYLGDGVSGIYIWGASLTTAENASKPYQKITDGVQDYFNYQALPVLYQNSTGTTPVTAVEQPVGLILDKSKGLVLGSELVTNGGFDSNISSWLLADSNASITWASGGYANIKMLTNTGGGSYQDVVLASGFAKVSICARKIGTSGNTYLVVHARGGFSMTLAFTTITSQTFTTYDFIVPATNGGFRVYLKVEFSGAEMEVDSVSVRELPGNHAFQATAASRPVLSARYNLLTKTEQFDDAVWTSDGFGTVRTISTNVGIAPDGTMTTDLAISTVTGETGAGAQRLTVASGIAVGSVYAKKGSVNWLRLRYIGPANAEAWFNLDTGTVGTVLSGFSSALIEPADNGFYKCTVRGADLTRFDVGFSSADNTRNSGIGASVYIWGADLRVANDGVNLPSYQRVNTATDYDSGPSWPKYLRFDGIDDSLSTSSINFTSTDKMSIFAGVRKLSDATRGLLLELSSTSESNNGAFALLAPYVASDKDFSAYLRGTSNLAVELYPYTAPFTSALTFGFNIAGSTAAEEIIGRVNGGAPTTRYNSGGSGTGNFGNYPLYIGRRGGTSSPFNGRIYSLIIRGAQSSDAQITVAENYVETKTFGKDMSYVYTDQVLTAASEPIQTADGQDIFTTVNYQ